MRSMTYLYLFLAIIAEVVGTSALKASNHFTKPIFIVITITGYLMTFYFMSLVFKVMPIGITYAIWSGLGVALITLVGIVWFKQTPDVPAIIGIILIIAGVITINIFSKTIQH